VYLLGAQAAHRVRKGQHHQSLAVLDRITSVCLGRLAEVEVEVGARHGREHDRALGHSRRLLRRAERVAVALALEAHDVSLHEAELGELFRVQQSGATILVRLARLDDQNMLQLLGHVRHWRGRQGLRLGCLGGRWLLRGFRAPWCAKRCFVKLRGGGTNGRGTTPKNLEPPMC
jgi:hypothetical protein